MKAQVWLAAGLATLAGCAGTTAPGPAPAVPAPVISTAVPSPMVRPVPVSNAYQRAVQEGTRSVTGAPGPAYWRNEASYTIAAEIEPRTALLRGSERIVYRNNSPTVLLSVVLNLYQNVFSEGVPRNRYAPITGGVTLDRVVAQGQALARRPTNQIPITVDVRDAPAGFSVQGTLARIRLPRPVAPGESVILEIDWQHTIPPTGSFRTAWEDALGSRAFLVAQWYPQIATYDDLTGWDTTPYLGDGEFYLDYADFDVSITLPAGFLVGATGELANARDVLTEEAQRRLELALRSDSITRVVTAADLTAENATQPSIDGQLTWRFTAEDVRDFAFAASGGYIWDATRALISDGGGGTRAVAVHSLYRPGAVHWENSAHHGQHSIRVFSDLVVPYPYPQMTIAEGPITGMEYPMITFIYRAGSEQSLYAVIAHEIAHEWFPMLVGHDEARYAWMDEGAATWMEAIAYDDYFDIDDSLAAEVENYLYTAGSDVEVPMMRHTDLVTPYGDRRTAAYAKPGVLFRSVRALLGEATFANALTTYTREWAGKHPTPWDFFRTMERFVGEPLDWFFYPWWFETAVLDQGIVSVTAGPEGTVVTVENLGDAFAPAPLIGITAAGDTVSATIPAESWVAGEPTATVTLPGTAPIVRVEIDPGQLFPDVNLENNVWEPALP
ncbi:MAG TPA: M1 family metallopeptidase [Longimicrobiaceae bacterium]|nr:M1 family metallopeptidase [Longimicrobiaceae bacterium]